MRTPPEIRKYCERRYWEFLRSIVEGRSIFPIEIRFGKTNRSADFEILRREVTDLANSGLNFNIEWVDVNTRRWGRQRLPTRISFEDEKPFVQALAKEKEVEKFRENIIHIRRELPELEGWLCLNIKRVVNENGAWPDLLKVCRYFLMNPRPGLYLRELPISVDTKFVERHVDTVAALLDFLLPNGIVPRPTRFEERFGLLFDQPSVRFRFLDDEWRLKCGFPVSDLSVPVRQFCELPLERSHVFITENKVNFLTLPVMEQGIAIFGGGEAVQLLSKAKWLGDCQIVYWGDIDAHGFTILSRLRATFPHVKSVMMDERTFDSFREATVAGISTREVPPAGLTEEEQHVFNKVTEGGLRLEQEKIPFTYVVRELKGLSPTQRTRILN